MAQTLEWSHPVGRESVSGVLTLKILINLASACDSALYTANSRTLIRGNDNGCRSSTIAWPHLV
jgi:hypothetical protein